MDTLETRRDRSRIPLLLVAVAGAFLAGLVAAPFLTGSPAQAASSVGEAGARHVLIVLSNAFEGKEAVFNDWYTNTHLPDVIQVDGFSGAQRFQLSPAQMEDGGGEPFKYLAIYEVAAADVTVPRDALRASTDSEGMYVDPALDRDHTVAWFYTPITGRLKR
jgi:hypothetical protein